MISETYQLWDDREDVKLTTFLHAGSPIPEIRRKRPFCNIVSRRPLQKEKHSSRHSF